MKESTRLSRAIAAIPKKDWIAGESNRVHWAGCSIASPSIVQTDDKTLVTCSACRGAFEGKP